jgi:beta-galactosidase
VAAWREWLRRTYGEVSALNEAWGNVFWGQLYSSWDEIDAPRYNHTAVNPAQRLDYARFANEENLGHYLLQRDILRRTGLPVTTNFAGTVNCKSMDLWRWAPELDVVANDHYLTAERPDNHIELAMSADLARAVAGGAPWMIMEHSTGAVNWQPRNIAKRPGELRRNSLGHVARGSDAVLYFQWRASRYGAEKFHSAMLPHAGTDSDLFRSVVSLGERLRSLPSVAGVSRTRAKAAILFDWTSWWAAELDSHPSSRLRYRQEALDWYTAFLELGVRADVVPPDADLSGYPVVVAPMLYVVPAALSSRLSAYVSDGGHLITTYFSGIVDENDHVWLGGYPGALRSLLGIRIEEFAPLLDDEQVALDNGTVGTLWTDRIDVLDAETLASYKTGEMSGRAAVTRRAVGSGSAAYVSTRLGPDGLVPVLDGLLSRAGVVSELPASLRGRVELAVRGPVRFYINRTDRPVELAGIPGAPAVLGPREVAVVGA